ncbi:hypothetical protein [Marinifilum sp. D737]|uniref:hypothetical protein n=1 Tax=Marinifilum sp. D737 TaxID=2969628 RepID=UPI002275192E|nr:hypothetical protein [Marinifilum sp. D737]MCY1635154.1 hypothetical protein [Marinifilum sp. D737]
MSRSLENILRKNLVKGRVSKGNKKLDNIIVFLFILGIALLTCEIYIYRKTLIELKIPLMIWLTPGIVLTPIFYNKLNDIDGMKAHWSLHYILHSCMTGAFVLFSFMAVNYFFADNEVVSKKFKVQETGSLSGGKGSRNKRSPYVVINYEGMEKQLVFSNSQMDKVMNSKWAVLKVRKGRLGFDVLENYTVK